MHIAQATDAKMKEITFKFSQKFMALCDDCIKAL